MQPSEIAADLGVVESRGCKGPLVVAGTATRRERVRVNVVLPVAVDAQVARASEPAIIDMAAVATLLIVGALEVEIANIVKSNDVRETLSRMAGCAVGSELAFVNLGFGVTRAATKAIGGSRLKGNAWMAVGAPNREVLTREFEITLRVVIENILASF